MKQILYILLLSNCFIYLSCSTKTAKEDSTTITLEEKIENWLNGSLEYNELVNDTTFLQLNLTLLQESPNKVVFSLPQDVLPIISPIISKKYKKKQCANFICWRTENHIKLYKRIELHPTPYGLFELILYTTN
jgi:hypothetical protein